MRQIDPKINKDFTQSYWRGLQFVPTKKNKPGRIFTIVCYKHPTEKATFYRETTLLQIMTNKYSCKKLELEKKFR